MIIMLQSASDVDGVGGDYDHFDDSEDGNLRMVIVKDTIFPGIFAFHYWASRVPDQDGDGLYF